MFRRTFLCALAAIALIGSAGAQTSAVVEPPKALIYYGGQAGRLTMDRDRLGGNPFASGLIDVLKDPKVRLKDFGMRLAGATAQRAGGWQQPDIPKRVGNPDWRISDGEGERRIALVLINADYRKSGIASLPGAVRDAQRVPEALTAAGFDVELVYDQSPETARAKLAEFSKRSEDADAALIYVGGHGIQHKRIAYWIMGDYPEQSAAHLGTHAIAIPKMAEALRAKAVNLVLYASCRDDPFQ